MTGKKEILQALKNEFAKCVPEAEHYFGKIGEGYSPPAFLYLPSFNQESRHNAFFQDTNREIQIIYFGRQMVMAQRILMKNWKSKKR